MTAPDVDARPPVRARLLPAPLILLCGLVLVPAGRFGDLYSRRTVFIIG